MKLLEKLMVWWLFRGGLDAVRRRIWARWGRARAVFGEAVGYGASRPFNHRLLVQIIERYPSDAREFFIQGLAAPNANVVGYSLQGLAIVDRDFLKTVEIPQSQRKITWFFACFGSDFSLERLRQMLISR